MRSRLALYATLSLSACGGLGDRQWEEVSTLADLQPVALPAEPVAQPRVSAPELTQIYRGLLEQNTSEESQLQIRHRLADIEMRAAEEALTSGTSKRNGFARAIEAYESLLRDYPDYAARDQILYQLSKAHDLNGEPGQSHAMLEQLAAQAPQSQHLTEAQFRRAERAFAETNYAGAEQLYSAVIGHGADTAYYTRALYMQGWARYKQAAYAGAIEAFTLNLDQLLAHEGAFEELDRASRELVADSLRVLGLAFSHLKGAQSIAELPQKRHYQHMLYQALGDLYLSQERYRDSAETFRSYISAHPLSGRAHQFQIQVIDAYKAGGFGELILAAKKDYVSDYAVTGEYWEISDGHVRARIRKNLGSFLEELAAHYHAAAQKERGKGADDGRSGEYYGLAAHYYQSYLQSFPRDEDAPRLAFLLADSLYEAGKYAQAIERYEQVAYVYQDASRGADAAYTAIVAYDKLSQQENHAGSGEEAGSLVPQRIEAELRFFRSFPEDPRASAVLAHAADELFQRREYESALAAATTLTQQYSGLDPQNYANARLLQAHSLFELQRFAGAEQAYAETAAMMPADDERLEGIVERLAAAIYRQGEAALEGGEDLAAASQFSRVLEVAPTSTIRVNAQFDSAAAYIRAGELAKANVLLLDFRSRYPQHELSSGIAGTLLQNYEQLEQWRDAAAELDRMQTTAASDDRARQALLVAAQYYERAEDLPRAIERYRNYARRWPQPVAERVEVMHRLSTLLHDAGQQEEYYTWLGALAQAHDNAAEQQSPRSRYLAAQAVSVLAEEAFGAFAMIRLEQPLAAALRRKKQGMEHALALYSRCNGYAVEEFSTLSNYRIAALYQLLSSDLLESERPSGLDALALEQYDLMLEEQAFPFEEKAIAAHESNIRRSREGVYDEWVKRSFDALALLVPARYGKAELADRDGLDNTSGFFKRRALRKVLGLNEEAILLREQGEFAAAEEIYLSALAVEAEHATTHRNLGILYDLYVGDTEKALHHYNRYHALTEGEDRAMAGWIADLKRRQSVDNRELI